MTTPAPKVTIKGWWWKKFFKKYRDLDQVMNDLVEWSWKNGGEEELNKAVLDSLINGKTTYSFVEKPYDHP